MKYIAQTFKGLEQVTEKELSGKKITDRRIEYTKSKKEIKTVLLSYELIKKIKFKNFKDLLKKVENSKINIKGTFRVDCSKEENSKINTQQVRETIGEIFFKKGNKVNLDNPNFTIFLDIYKNTCFLGMNPKTYKRDYKVRSSRDSINSSLGASLLKIAKLKKTDTLLDPFCSDGVILIEAGLFGAKKLYGLAEDTKNASINSKVAKVKINLSKNELDWLDTSFKEKSVDKIITKPLFFSKRRSKEDVYKTTKELFHQTKYILKKNGLLLTLCPKTELLEKYAKEYKFKAKKETEVQVGDLLYKINSFKKI
ncbi:hypothetical protein CL617_01410 [archaeon]|nr:hypothetical protein [archaeon]|tara:strand:+ start:1739 stop:2671 length:933 start_codon:yes stop_codon:yes gene_type:complete